MLFPTRLRPVSLAARAPSQTRPLIGMYALLALAVGCVGASAGELFFNGDGTLSTPFESAENRCLLSYPLAVHLQQLDRCQEGSYRSQGLFVLGCVGGMLLLTAALMLIVPWLDRRRLARTRQFTDIEGITTAVTARFGALCDQAGLTGRRRPRLVVAAVPEAFTIALPGGQPLVVLPVTIALAWAQPGRFDPVVLHELAHVRARDVSLVSSVRGIAWVTIPGSPRLLWRLLLADMINLPFFPAVRSSFLHILSGECTCKRSADARCYTSQPIPESRA